MARERKRYCAGAIIFSRLGTTMSEIETQIGQGLAGELMAQRRRGPYKKRHWYKMSPLFPGFERRSRWCQNVVSFCMWWSVGAVNETALLILPSTAMKYGLLGDQGRRLEEGEMTSQVIMPHMSYI